MIAVALPQLVVFFHASVGATTWLVTAYLITMAVLQPISGKLGDRLGQRRMILGGLLAFGVASVGAALAPSLSALLFFRILQAASAALTIPNGVALLRQIVPALRRGARFGTLAGVTSMAAALGPPVGGLIIGWASWRMMFAINVLIVLPALLLGWRVLPRVDRKPKQRFDTVGGLVLSVILAGLALLLGRQGLSAGSFVVSAMAIVGLGAIFIRYELRHADPIVQPRYFSNRSFRSATMAIMLSNLAMYTTLLSLPLLLVGRRGWTEATVGLLLMSFSGTTALAAPLGGYLADRKGRRWPAVFGLLIFSTSMLPLVWSQLWSHSWWLVACLMVGGAGNGIYAAGAQAAALEALRPEEAGAAAGVYSTCRYLGSIVGSSMLAGLVALGTRVDALRPVYILIFLGAGAASLAATRLHGRPRFAHDVPDASTGM